MDIMATMDSGSSLTRAGNNPIKAGNNLTKGSSPVMDNSSPTDNQTTIKDRATIRATIKALANKIKAGSVVSSSEATAQAQVPAMATPTSELRRKEEEP